MLVVITHVCVYTANVSVLLRRICSPETVSADSDAMYHNSLLEPVHQVRSVRRTNIYKYFVEIQMKYKYHIEYFSRYEKNLERKSFASE